MFRYAAAAIESGSGVEQKSMDWSEEKKKSLRARYKYGVIFLLTNLCAWFIRDYGQKLLPQLHCE